MKAIYVHTQLLVRAWKQAGYAAAAYLMFVITMQSLTTWIWVRWSFEADLAESIAGATMLTVMVQAGIRMTASSLLPPLSFHTESRIRRYLEKQLCDTLELTPLISIQTHEHQELVQRIVKQGNGSATHLFMATCNLLAQTASLIVLMPLIMTLPLWLLLTWTMIPIAEGWISWKLSSEHHRFIMGQTGKIRRSTLLFQWISQPAGLSDLRASGHTQNFGRERNRLLEELDRERFRFGKHQLIKKGLGKVFMIIMLSPGLWLLYRQSQETPVAMAGLMVVAVRTWQAFRGMASSVSDLMEQWPHWAEASGFFRQSEGKPQLIHGQGVHVPFSMKLERVSFGFKNSEPIFRKLSLDMPAGSLMVVKGRNGSGKTTLARILAGLYKPGSGSVNNLQPVGLISQDFPILEGPVQEQVAAPGISPGRLDVGQCLRLSGFERVMLQKKLNMRSEVGLTFKGHTALSRGEWQMLALARMLYRSSVLIMDEPDSFLDVHQRNNLFNTLNYLKGKMTIVIFTHHHHYDQVATHLFRLDGGDLYPIKPESRRPAALCAAAYGDGE